MKHIDQDTSTAVILRFPRRRGRPKTMRPRTDTGTPELVMKRLLAETTEVLDLCLERQIITREQHWCGIHLRWLHTLRYGAPGVRAIDPTHLGGIEYKIDDPEWRSAREQEYHEAMLKLKDAGYATLLRDICIYNERPSFLNRNKLTAKSHKIHLLIVNNLRNGLDLLASHWGRAERKADD